MRETRTFSHSRSDIDLLLQDCCEVDNDNNNNNSNAEHSAQKTRNVFKTSCEKNTLETGEDTADEIRDWSFQKIRLKTRHR